MTHPIQSETADWLDDLFDGMTVDPATGEIVAMDGPPPEVANDLTGRLDDRIDGYAAALRRMEFDANVCAQEAERLKIRQRVIENRAKRLREWIAYCMTLAGRKKVATATTTATIVQNGGKHAVEWTRPPEELPIEYVETIVMVKPDTDKARAELEAGVELPFARLVPRGLRLQIR